MNITKKLTAIAVASVVASAAQASEFSDYESDNAVAKVSGSKCDGERESGLFADLSLVYSVGPNAGTYSSHELEYSGPFVAHGGDMRQVKMGLTFEDFDILNADFNEIGVELCEDFDGIDESETEVMKFEVVRNKRDTTAKLNFSARTMWTDTTARERDHSLKITLKANMDKVDVPD